MPKNWDYEKYDFKFENFKSPYDCEVPWPCMRGNIQNSGRLKNLSSENRVRKDINIMHFQTNNAIFSTPVIGKNDIIYVGSADHFFYALDPVSQNVLWKKEYEEIIDSAACIGKNGNIYVGAGDGKIHAYNPDGLELWFYDAVNDRNELQLSFSSNFWFEANIVFGPDGALYTANDDFFLYKITPHGEIIWGFRTGFLIWSAAAFWKDGTVYVAGFDHCLYALNSIDGKLKWKRDLKGSMVGSSAIMDDGTIIQTSFNGNIYAVDHKNGKIKWKYETGSHIYASAAIAEDNTIYLGSTNGIFYALDGSNGLLKWTYYIGEPIRASASIGPDIEKLEPYLIYFGGGNGLVYAIEPNGTVRWSYDTLVKAMNIDYPNINASIALGQSGIAIASSTGDIIWIPYDYYMRENNEGIHLGNELDSNEKGIFWHYITPGGKLKRIPLTSTQEIAPINTISIRLIEHGKNGMLPRKIIPKSLDIEVYPPFSFRFRVQSDLSTVYIIPETILSLDQEYKISVNVEYHKDINHVAKFSDILVFKTPSNIDSSQNILDINKGYKIVHMALPQPPIVPSLDQIGLASLKIPFRVIEKDTEKKRFIAWAAQLFGEIGVPQKRVSFYGFSGYEENNYFLMESKNCLYEITAFNMPIENFRVAGLMQIDGNVKQGGSLIIEKHWGKNLFKLLGEMGTSSPLTPKKILAQLKRYGLIEFMRGISKFIPSLIHQFFRNVWKTWGLLNFDYDLIGIGTFKTTFCSIDERTLFSDARIQKFELLKGKRQIVVELLLNEIDLEWYQAICICLADIDEMKIIPLNYNTAMKYKKRGNRVTAILDIPKDVLERSKCLKAYLMLNLELVKSKIL